MKLNRTELKKVIYDFNSFSNRLLRADAQEYNTILAKFIYFIDNQPLIMEYIIECGLPTFDVAAEVKAVKENYNMLFETGETTEQEVTNIYHILKYLIDNDILIPRTVAMRYASSSKLADNLKAYNERFVLVFIRHIEGYLTKIGIDMGMDESIKYNITNTGGQVIVANDNASVTATMNNGVDISTLDALLKTIKEMASGLSKNDTDTVHESVEVIESELRQEKPRKSFLSTAIKGLQAIKGSTEFAAAVTTLVQFIQQSFLI